MQYDDKKSCVHCVSMHALGKRGRKTRLLHKEFNIHMY